MLFKCNYFFIAVLFLFGGTCLGMQSGTYHERVAAFVGALTQGTDSGESLDPSELLVHSPTGVCLCCAVEHARQLVEMPNSDASRLFGSACLTFGAEQLSTLQKTSQDSLSCLITQLIDDGQIGEEEKLDILYEAGCEVGMNICFLQTIGIDEGSRVLAQWIKAYSTHCC